MTRFNYDSYSQVKMKTTKPDKLLEKIMHIASNELDLLLGKTARNAPLEAEEVRKLQQLSGIITDAIKTQILTEKASEKAVDAPQLTVTPEAILALTTAAKDPQNV